MKIYKNILIVRTDRIGDVVLTTPVIHVLRENFPQARLAMLVTPATRDLVDGNPDLNKVLVDDRQGVHRGIFGFWRLVGSLQKEDFDLAIIFHTKRRTNLACFLAGISNRIGYADNKLGVLLTHKLIDTRHTGNRHESQYCLDILRAMGLTVHNIRYYIPLHKSAEEWAQRFLQDHRLDSRHLIAIHPGASDPTKQWPANRFAELMKQLRSRYASQFILIGAGNAKAAAEQIKTQLSFYVMDLTGQTTVSQLSSLLKRCRMLISNDSGPVHVADALGTPVVSIFTRNQPGINSHRWQPLGKYSRTVLTPFTGEMSFAHKKPVSLDYLELISVPQVLEEVDAIFKLC